jgi:auxin response factor
MMFVLVYPVRTWTSLILSILLLSSGENGQLRVGVRRASKQLPITRSTYFSSANLHLGVLAAASHAAKEMIRFSVIYNPRLVLCMGDSWRVFFDAIAATTLQAQHANRSFLCRTSPSEFVIPYHKFLKAEENNFTVGSRFKMKFESDESTERRYCTCLLRAVFSLSCGHIS